MTMNMTITDNHTTNIKNNYDYHKNLISIIKSDNRHDFYNIFDKKHKC
jgi:hypothetical protein